MAQSIQFNSVIPFLDMDGVLVNFEKGCQNLMGPYFAYRHLPPAQFAVYRTELFNRIEATPSFWEDLEPMPDALELYEGVLKLGVEPHILTAVPRHFTLADPGAMEVASQKQRWIKKYLGDTQSQAFTATLGHLKQEHQKPGRFNLLIDDLPSNIQRWNRNSPWAHGILHTSAQNSLNSLTWWLNNA